MTTAADWEAQLLEAFRCLPLDRQAQWLVRVRREASLAVVTSEIQDGRSRRRKNEGTGLHDTPPETWAKMRDSYERGASLADCARASCVLYSAVHSRASREKWKQPAPTTRSAGYAEGFRLALLEEGERLPSTGRGRVVRPESDGLAAVIELRPRKHQGPIEVPDDYEPEPPKPTG